MAAYKGYSDEDLDQRALVAQMRRDSGEVAGPRNRSANTGFTGGGLYSPGERASDQPPAIEPAAEKKLEPSGYKDFVHGALKQHGYGPQALAAARPELEKAGFKVQISGTDTGFAPNADGSGEVRGRIYDPTGRRWNIYDKAEGTTATDNWNTNLRGKEWGWEDAGFDEAPGGGVPQAAPGPAQSLSALSAGIPIDSGFFQQLMQQLSSRTGGPAALDQAALLAQMKR